MQTIIFGGIFDPLRKELRRNVMKAIFSPFESLVDNTLYGRDFKKKVGGVKNIIISDFDYELQRIKETQRIYNMENMISKFLAFQNRMTEYTV
jgi:hypothetical protein